MGKIIFYENKIFEGHQYECSGDCADILCYLGCCNSIMVESGCFMIYEQPYYKGQQFLVRKGEYPDFESWLGKNDCVCSCREIPMAMTQGSSHEVNLFERMEYGGQMMALVEDCPNVMDMFQTNHIFSCKVIGGNWLFFEQSNYKGMMYLMRPGEYTRFTEWGGLSARVGSIKRIIDN
ncbi:beta-crystallin S-1-like isoform X1 [Sinocyclocheilus anshuiensis]|uniref:beta-crystallin S-1-like isoform X1 n=1 Tax=Sinocyclocheilus anshuiensis TaxID=1608454 RepID=UPI0007B8EDBF|nr:PREDICTED: beta-crystallin S-1-like isoform X1 [Sinocyclocheilus anshuiensis]